MQWQEEPFLHLEAIASAGAWLAPLIYSQLVRTHVYRQEVGTCLACQLPSCLPGT